MDKADKPVAAGNSPKGDAAKEHGVSPASSGGETTVREIGGPKGPEPTRYGDWERNGRCSDF